MVLNQVRVPCLLVIGPIQVLIHTLIPFDNDLVIRHANLALSFQLYLLKELPHIVVWIFSASWHPRYSLRHLRQFVVRLWIYIYLWVDHWLITRHVLKLQIVFRSPQRLPQANSLLWVSIRWVWIVAAIYVGSIRNIIFMCSFSISLLLHVTVDSCKRMRSFNRIRH